MAVVTSKTGSQSEPFNVFKQKLGKQTSFKGFKQHFSSITTINHDKSTKTNKTNFVATTEEETVDEKRGFTPSDVLNDPSKKEFLTQLSKRMWMEKEKFLSKRRVQFLSQIEPPFLAQTLYSLSPYLLLLNTDISGYGPIDFVLTCF